MASELSPEEILKQSKLPNAPPMCTWALDKSKCGPCPHRISPQRFGLVVMNRHSLCLWFVFLYLQGNGPLLFYSVKRSFCLANIITIHSAIDVRLYRHVSKGAPIFITCPALIKGVRLSSYHWHVWFTVQFIHAMYHELVSRYGTYSTFIISHTLPTSSYRLTAFS